MGGLLLLIKLSQIRDQVETGRGTAIGTVVVIVTVTVVVIGIMLVDEDQVVGSASNVANRDILPGSAHPVKEQEEVDMVGEMIGMEVAAAAVAVAMGQIVMGIASVGGAEMVVVVEDQEMIDLIVIVRVHTSAPEQGGSVDEMSQVKLVLA